MSNVIVGFANELESDAFGEKCAEALARGAVKTLANFFIAGEGVFAPTHQFPAEPRANAAIRVLNRLRLILETQSGVEMKRFF